MNCPRCGAYNPPGATVCRECGTPLYPQQGYGSPAPRSNSGTAIASLVCGILGWTVLPFIGSVLAIILGHMAMGEIKRSGGLMGGKGMATVGLILGYAAIVLSLIGVILAISIFGCGLCATMTGGMSSSGFSIGHLLSTLHLP